MIPELKSGATHLFVLTGHNVRDAQVCQHYGTHTQNLSKTKTKKNCCLFAMNLRKTYQIKHADVNILQIVLFARAHKCFNETFDAEHIDEVNEFLLLTLS